MTCFQFTTIRLTQFEKEEALASLYLLNHGVPETKIKIKTITLSRQAKRGSAKQNSHYYEICEKIREFTASTSQISHALRKCNHNLLSPPRVSELRSEHLSSFSSALQSQNVVFLLH